MFCPNCKTEYRKGFSQCSDCHLDLLSAPLQVNEPLQWFCPKCETKYPDSCNVCSHCHVDLEASVCPKCKAKYEQWARQCSDCCVDLVNTNPERSGVEAEDEAPFGEEPVLLTVSDNLCHAHATKLVLEEQRIRCLLLNDDPARLNKAIQLFVKKEDVEEARKVISGLKWDSSGGQTEEQCEEHPNPIDDIDLEIEGQLNNWSSAHFKG